MSLYRHILCPVDYSPASAVALVEAADLQKATGAKLTLAHFVEPLAMPEYAFGYIEVNPEVVTEAEKQLHTMAKSHNLIDAELRVEKGLARTGIIELINEHNIDLVVLGRKGHHGLTDRILGSTSNYIVNHANCSVLVTHEKTETRSVINVKTTATAIS